MRNKYVILASACMATLVAIAIWGWSLYPEKNWLLVVLVPGGFWTFLELMQGGGARREKAVIMNWHRTVVAVSALLLALAVSSKLAIAAGLLDAEWAPLMRRLRGVLFGCALAIWGNYLPKMLSPWTADEEWFDWQRVHRFAGLLATLTGAVLVLVWLFWPLESARSMTRAITATFALVVVGRKFWSVAAYSRRPSLTARPSLLEPSDGGTE